MVMQAVYVQVGERFEQFSNEVIAMVDCFPPPSSTASAANWQLHRLVDLDCDLTPEILRAAALPDGPAGLYTRLEILHRDWDGSLNHLAEYVAPADGAGWFGPYQVISEAGLTSDPDAREQDCGGLLALPELDAAGEITATIFLGWDGETLREVGNLPGRTLQGGSFSYQGALVMLAPRQVQPGVCLPVQTYYTWETGTFNPIRIGGQAPLPLCQNGAGY